MRTGFLNLLNAVDNDFDVVTDPFTTTANYEGQWIAGQTYTQPISFSMPQDNLVNMSFDPNETTQDFIGSKSPNINKLIFQNFYR